MRRSLQVLALVFVLGLLLGLAWLLSQKQSPLYQPIKSYQLTSTIQQVSQQELDAVIEPYLGHSFWDIPLDELQADLVRLDWILDASVKRKWPNLLFVAVEEQTAVARWHDHGLVNRMGEVFFPTELTGFENLVQLNGKLEASAKILKGLAVFQQQLAPLEMMVARLSLSSDGVWRIQTLNGVTVVVDDANHVSKIDRFVRAHPQIESELRNSASVYDLRYSNGFIVGQ